MIVVSYDGSADAQTAIDGVARLMPGAQATVLTVWEPYSERLTITGADRTGLDLPDAIHDDVQRVDAANEDAALATATEGAQHAVAAGVFAHPLAARCNAGLANTILRSAAQLQADLVVMGTRGRSGLRAFLLGSISHTVVQHADRAVLVVPSQPVPDDRGATTRTAANHDEESTMILVSYDGSADAQAAIDRVAQFAPGAEVTVLTVWLPFVDMMMRTGAGMGLGLTASYGVAESTQIDAASREAALATAAEGAQHATAAGLVATPRAERRDGDVAQTILAVAESIEADVIAMGTRGLSGVKAFVLGSVSHGVVQHADRAVLVVPAPALVARRRHQIERDVART